MKATRIQIAMDSIRRPQGNVTTAGPLAILLARLIIWFTGEGIHQLLAMKAERDYLQTLLSKEYVTEWKTTKKGGKRYRKVATPYIAHRWRTQSEKIHDEVEMVKLPIPQHGQCGMDFANEVW